MRHFPIVSVLSLFFLLSFAASANIGAVAGDTDGDGCVDAIDVQVLINAALGLGNAGFAGDINFDSAIDAVDMQLVINAALGLDITGQLNRGAFLVGWVIEEGGDPVPRAQVSIEGIDTVYTNTFGLYTIEAAPVAKGLVIRFSADGYAPSSRIVDTRYGQLTGANVVLVRKRESRTLNADTGGTVGDEWGNRITIPAGGLVTENGEPVTGNVQVGFPQPYWNYNISAMLPGDFLGIAVGAEAGKLVHFENLAVAYFDVTQNGKRVYLDAKKQATAHIELYLGYYVPFVVAQKLPCWHFDDAQGVWVESGTGTVDYASDGYRDLAWYADISHFSWCGCNRRIEQAYCLTGRVLDEDGTPVGGAQVSAESLDCVTASFATTDPNGEYRVDMACGSDVVVEVVLPGGVSIADSATVLFPHGYVCGGPDAECRQIRDLAPSYGACIRGYAMDDFGNPLPGAHVFCSGGTRTMSGDDGFFCMAAPEDSEVVAFVFGRQPVCVNTPSYSQYSPEDCAEVLLNVHYPGEGDVVGQISTISLVDFYSEYEEDVVFGEYECSWADFFMYNPFLVDNRPANDTWEVYPFTTDDSSYGGWVRRWMPLLQLGGLEVAPGTGALDPGAFGTVSDGNVQNEMVRTYDLGFSSRKSESSRPDLSPLAQLPLAKNWFEPSSVDNSMGNFQESEFWDGAWHNLSCRASLIYTWPGGRDIGPFDAVISPPAYPHLTSPESIEYRDDSKSLSSGVHLVWDASEPGDCVFVYVEASPFPLDYHHYHYWKTAKGKDLAKQEDYYGFALTAVLEDDGEHTIPAEDLPAEALAEPHLANILISRIRVDKVPVPLARAHANGIVNVVACRSEHHYSFTAGEKPDYGDTPDVAEEILADCQPITGQLASEADVDWFRFEAVSGHTYKSYSYELPRLSIYGTDGATLLAQSDSFDGYLVLWTCPASGAYFLKVEHSELYDGKMATSSVSKQFGGWLPYRLAVCDLGVLDGVVHFPDAALEAAIRNALNIHDRDLTESDARSVVFLDADDSGIVDLTGLESCRELITLDLDGNAITGIDPIAALGNLESVSLERNQIVEIDALVANPALGKGDDVYLHGNPLSEHAIKDSIPALEARGVDVWR